MREAFLLKKLNILEENLLNKKELRRFFIERLSMMSKERKIKGSQEACLMLKNLAKDKKMIASFAPSDTEIDIWNFNKAMMSQKKLVLPKVSGKDLIFYPVTSMKDLELSNWKVLEPIDTTHAIEVETVSFFIIPGLAFDIYNHRLGKGKGYYDTFISLHKIENTVGIGYKEQYSKFPLPTELHDQSLKEVFLF